VTNNEAAIQVTSVHGVFVTNNAISTPFRIGEETAQGIVFTALACEGSGFLTAWVNRDSGTALHWARISTNGAVADGMPKSLTLATNKSIFHVPSIASAGKGNGFVIVWDSGPSTFSDSDIFAASIASDGALQQTNIISSTGQLELQPTVSFVDGSYAIGWTARSPEVPALWQVRGAFMTTNGNITPHFVLREATNAFGEYCYPQVDQLAEAGTSKVAMLFQSSSPTQAGLQASIIDLRPSLDAISLVNDQWQLSFTGVDGMQYAMEASADLGGSWTTIAAPLSCTNFSGAYVDANPANARRLYRLHAVE
jgi:hypothetical protein